MTPRGMMTVATALLCFSFILGLLSPALAARPPCCTRYNRRPIPFQRIKGYREQTTMDYCRIEAIIFYTVGKNEICATRKDKWVRKTLELLSAKLKKMSKAGSAAGKTQMRRNVTPDERGSLFSSTETFLNSTESFY